MPYIVFLDAHCHDTVQKLYSMLDQRVCQCQRAESASGSLGPSQTELRYQGSRWNLLSASRYHL